MNPNHARSWYRLCGVLGPILLCLFLLVTGFTGHGGCGAFAAPTCGEALPFCDDVLRIVEMILLAFILVAVVDVHAASAGGLRIPLPQLTCFLLAGVISATFILVLHDPWMLLMLFSAGMGMLCFDMFAMHPTVDRSSAREFVCIVSSVVWAGDVYLVMHSCGSLLNFIALNFFLWVWTPIICVLCRVISAPGTTSVPAGSAAPALIPTPVYVASISRSQSADRVNVVTIEATVRVASE